MPEIIYPGPSDGVSVRLEDGTHTLCERDTPVELPDAIAAGLLEQGWTEPAAEPPAPKPKAKRQRKTEPAATPDPEAPPAPGTTTTIEPADAGEEG